MKRLPINTSIYHYHNANPKGKSASDCVVRAICVATNQTWEYTMMEMVKLGIKIGYVFNETRTIDKYLIDKGWTKNREPRNVLNKKITLARFLADHKRGTYIATVGSHHTTLIVNGVVYDTWDCTRKTMHTYYSNPNAPLTTMLEKPCDKPKKKRFTL